MSEQDENQTDPMNETPLDGKIYGPDNTGQAPKMNEFDAFAKYYEEELETGCQKIKQFQKQVEFVKVDEDYGNGLCDLYQEIEAIQYENYHDLSNLPIRKFDYVQQVMVEQMQDPGSSMKVKAVETVGKGVGWCASVDLPENTVLIVEKASVLQVNPTCECLAKKNASLFLCHHCGKVSRFFFTCETCHIAIFCSKICLTKSKKYHKFECLGFQHHFWPVQDATDFTYLAMRMVLYGAEVNFDPHAFLPGHTYSNVYFMKSNFNLFPKKVTRKICSKILRTLVYLKERTTFFEMVAQDMSYIPEACRSHYGLMLFIGGLMLRHYCQAQLNSVLLKFPNYGVGCGLQANCGIGKAVCPVIGMLNHSCDPNAILIYCNDVVVVKSFKKIAADEEILICYQEITLHSTTHERQLIMKTWYYFECKCKLCCAREYNQPVYYKCSSCLTGRMLMNPFTRAAFCMDCTAKSEEDFDRICALIHVTEEIPKQADPNFESRLLSLFQDLYCPNTCRFMSIYVFLCENAIFNDNPDILLYGLRAVEIMEKRMHCVYRPLLAYKLQMFNAGINELELRIGHTTPIDMERLMTVNAKLIEAREFLAFYNIPSTIIDDMLCSSLKIIDAAPDKQNFHDRIVRLFHVVQFAATFDSVLRIELRRN